MNANAPYLQTSALRRPAVPAILQQHLEDAAYVWSCHQDGIWSPFFNRDYLHRFDQQLDAHLEGLRIAGAQAIAPALKNLQRWQTPEEIFVTTYILLHQPNANVLVELEQALIDTPSLASGAAAALLWTAPNLIPPFVDRWWFSEAGILRQLVIPAALIHPQLDREKFIQQGLTDSYPGVRARAYRAIGEWQLPNYHTQLKCALGEEPVKCRFEAATALALLGDCSALIQLPEAFSHLENAGLRRALLIWATLSDSQQFKQWFLQHNHRPEQYRLLLWAIAFRGDPAYLTCLGGFIEQACEAKLAAYALCHITGLNLQEQGLCLPEPELDAEAQEDPIQKEHSDDTPLPQPDPQAVLAWIERHQSHFKPEQRYSNGQPIDQVADTLYHQGLQPQRWQAAVHLTINKTPGAMPALLHPMRP